MMKIPNIEISSRAEIEVLQSQKLTELLAYVNNNSPFYQRFFKENNIDLSQIKSMADLSKIPTIDKNVLQQAKKDLICVDQGQIVDYCNTSGTEGTPVTVPLTEKDLQRLAYNEALSLACTGGSSDEVYQLTTTINRRFMAGMAYALGARHLGAGMVRIGPGAKDLQWQTIVEIEPTTLIVVPSFLLKLIEFAEENNIDFRNSSIKKAVCIGEPIRTVDFQLNSLGKRISEKWNIQLYSTYASTEMATAFTECAFGKGGHAHPELIITEILDEQDNPVADGNLGELAVTTLGVEGFPLIRFKTGDICARHSEKCECGRTTYRLGPVMARKNQMIKFKGTTLFPSTLFDLLDNIPELDMYLVEVSSDQYNNDHILIRYASQGNFQIEQLTDRFQSRTRTVPSFEKMPIDALQKVKFPEASRKPIKFIDKRIKLDI